MKLKKIASLMLAGVMAVSMLAGCSDKGGASSEDQNKEPATGVNAQAVIDAMSLNTTNTIDFTVGTNLQAVADKAAANYEAGKYATFDAELLHMIDDTVSEKASFPGLGDAADNAKTQEITYVASVKDNGVNDETIVKSLIKDFENKVTDANYPTESGEFKDTVDGKKATYKYTFDYTADVAVTSTTNESNGQATYYLVIELTRTPTKTAVED